MPRPSSRRVTLALTVLTALCAVAQQPAYAPATGPAGPGTDFFASPLYMSPESVQRAVGRAVFQRAGCAVDSTCDPAWEAQRGAVVQLTHPILGNFCTGTLVRGPNGDAVYVLTARHCVASPGPSAVYPWSSFGVILNYRVPCGTTSVANLTEAALGDQYLQGLRVAFLDEGSDVALLALLADVPPDFNATLQGWDARELGLPGEWVDISQPRGAGETVTYGVATGVLARQVFSTDGLAQLDASPCEGAGCGFVTAISLEGALEPGSSGSAMLDKASRRALGVLSSGGGQACDFNPSSAVPPINVFGRLAAAWGQGLSRFLGPAASDEDTSSNSTAAEAAQYRDGEPYALPAPGLWVGNSVPEVWEGGAAQTFAVSLTEPPPGGPAGTTTVRVSVDGGSAGGLVALPEGGVALVFNSSNWAEAQLVQLLDGPAVLPGGEYGATFNVALSWAVAGGAGSAGTRTRILTGVYRLNTPGTSFANPAPVDSLPWAREASLAEFSPANTFLANAEGPFLPIIFLRYTAPEAQGVVFTVCPEAGANYQPRGFIYDDRWAYYSVLPQLALAPDQYSGCQAQLAILDAGQTYYLVAAPSNLFTLPGAAAGVTGNMLLDVQAISVVEAADALYQAGEVQVANTAILPWTGVAALKPYGDPTILFLSADMDRVLDLSTCAPGTTAAASIAVYAIDDLQLVGSASATSACSELLGLRLTGGYGYLVILGQDPSQVMVSAAGEAVQLVIAESGSGNSGGGDGSGGGYPEAA